MKEITLDEIIERLDSFDVPDFSVVVGISEGGKVPASLVARKLDSELKLVRINYRDEENNPQHPEPVLLDKDTLPQGDTDVLLVDDVSVSGKTLAAARSLLGECNVKTFVLKGEADYVLFPEIDSCVKWPWSA